MRIAAVVVLSCLPTAAAAQPQPQDRTALAACLDKAGAKGETCIGAIRNPCLEKPDAGTTAGMKDCVGRESEAWDERLNAAYRKLLPSALGTQKTQRAQPSGAVKKLTGADILRDAQRAWILFRDKKCDAAGLPMEGGTGAGLLAGECYLVETARQALWLEDLARGP